MATFYDGLFFDGLDRPYNGQIVFSDEEREMIHDKGKIEAALARIGLMLGVDYPELADDTIRPGALRAVVSELGPMRAITTSRHGLINHGLEFEVAIRAGQWLGEQLRIGNITPKDISDLAVAVNKENN